MNRESNQPVLSVKELNREARIAIEERFRVVWVMGEMSNFARPRSGHWYFTLKDDDAQVRCAMFANRNRAVQMQPGDGQLVLLRGRVSLYEGRGEFQIIVDNMEPAGEGALRQAFDKLKLKLHAEGLFDPSAKRALPDFPRHCAVITSPTGAAIRDVLAVWQSRYPKLNVTLIPTLVQGADAEPALIHALERAQALTPDVILLTRGGGSLEDLWCFNSEPLARAIHESSIPVVSAVGHEIDTTIADLVADARAPTPSAGAAMIAPDAAELADEFAAYERHLLATAQRYLAHQALIASSLLKRLPAPARILNDMAQRVDDAAGRGQRSIESQLELKRTQWLALQQRLLAQNPNRSLAAARSALTTLVTRIQRAGRHSVAERQGELGAAVRMLESLSPLPTLARGYTILRDDSGRVVSRRDQLETGMRINGYLSDGAFTAEVASISDETLAKPLD